MGRRRGGGRPVRRRMGEGEDGLMGGMFSNIAYSMFILIFLYLVVRNSSGFSAVMKQGGTTTVSLVKALQGR